MIKYFDFEKSIEEIDKKIKDLEDQNDKNNINIIKKYQAEKKELYNKSPQLVGKLD